MKKEFIILIPLVVIGILLIFKGLNFTKDIVTKKKTDDSELPQVNIEGTNAKALNDYLNKLYEETVEDGKSKFNYTYSKYNNIISILVKIDKYRNKEYVTSYIGFNINKNGNYLSNEDVAKMFNYEFIDIYDIVDGKLKEYYEDEKNQGYLHEEECDYTCYLKYMRNMTDLINAISLVIEDNKLVAYVNLSIDSYVGDKDYFENLGYDAQKIVIE